MKSDKPTIPEVLPLVYAYRDSKLENGIGGNLHIVLSDGNVADGDVEFCRARAEESGDLFGVKLAEILARMSKTQRRKIASVFFSG